VARRERAADFAPLRFAFRADVRRTLALPPRRDFADRARRALLDLPLLLLPRVFTEERREVLVFLRDVDAFLRPLAGRFGFDFAFERERGALRKPIAFFAVAPIGWPVAAALPAIAPITPPTTAPTGPPTLPSTAPAAAPAAGLEIGGMVMFSFDCCSLDVEFSVDSSAISSPGLMFKLRSHYRHLTAASRKGINKKRPTCESGRFSMEYKFGLAGSAIAAAITTATAAATTVATATSATTAATVTTTTAALRASFARTRFVHGQSATFHGFAIKLGNGTLCFLFRRHRHESEATRLACEFILHKHDILHSTSLCEEILKVGFRRIERKISNV
jgi:hypothetical protein